MLNDDNQPFDERLIAEITRRLRSTLCDVIEVRVPKSHIVLADPEFWRDCELLTPNPRENLQSRIFVDGFDGCCHWNSWKVYSDAIEEGLSFWAGFAFGRDAWFHHEWCMLGNRIVETTAPYNLYYGARIRQSEIETINLRFSGVDLTGHVDPKVGVWTFVNERREVVPYDPSIYGKTIGRERDAKTSVLKEGLGR